MPDDGLDDPGIDACFRQHRDERMPRIMDAMIREYLMEVLVEHVIARDRLDREDALDLIAQRDQRLPACTS